MFGRRKEVEESSSPQPAAAIDEMLVWATECPESFYAQLTATQPLPVRRLQAAGFQSIATASHLLAVSPSDDDLNALLAAVTAARSQRQDGMPTLIIAVRSGELRRLGTWLQTQAVASTLEGCRVIAYCREDDIVRQLADRLGPVREPNVIAMPLSPEVEKSPLKYFYCFSQDLRSLATHIKALAENNVTRLYLLGGPGTGKTSIAYYYYLSRGKGNFIAINLTAESTGDKAAMKSLLCGHVTGALPGAPQREGALTFARDGVCFLDESHGVTGVVMQVLMEVLDNGQFLPLGATMKRSLECAVIFASNRSWQTLRDLIHLDEHARLGATIVSIKDLAARPEDIVAVAGTTLAGFAKQCVTWRAPDGFTEAAWQRICSCPWRGNTRTLIRVIETAAVSVASEGGGKLIDDRHVLQGLELWEPEEHPDKELFTSFR